MSTSPLIDCTALAALLQDPHTLLVDCRSELLDHQWGQRQYEAGHLPGAVFASLGTDLSAPVTAGSGRHPLPQAAQFAALLSSWGVTEQTRIVAYDQGPGPYAARLWWLLRARGGPAAQVLDGGWAAWVAAGLPVTQDLPPAHAATQVPVREFTGTVDAADVAAAAQDRARVLIDARGADRFAGQNETIDPIAGHVPGAVNQPFTANLVAGRFADPAALRERWQQVLGPRAPQQLISMCGSGITACHNLLALELAGLGGGQLYPGSWSHWIRDPARPVASGAT
jgi:thiosulfate/3-mercaptopyruvate sulfurtransferase